MSANAVRGEGELVLGARRLQLRPTFDALVRAEGELGSLFELVDRAAAGAIRLDEMVTLFWHCLHERPDDLDRARLGEEVVAAGLARATPALRAVLTQVLQGR